MFADGSGHARLQVLTGFGGFGLFWGAWGAALPALEHSAGATNGQLGVALLMVGLGAIVAMPLAGKLLDRFGHRVIVISLACFGGMGVLPGISHGLMELSIFTFMLGVGSGATDVCINSLAIRFERSGRGRILNTAHATFSGSMVGGSLVVAMLRSFGWQAWSLLLFAQIVILATAILVMPSKERWENPGRQSRLVADLIGTCQAQ